MEKTHAATAVEGSKVRLEDLHLLSENRVRLSSYALWGSVRMLRILNISIQPPYNHEPKLDDGDGSPIRKLLDSAELAMTQLAARPYVSS